MGFIDFVKDAGAKLFGLGDDKKEDKKAAPRASAPVVAMSPDEARAKALTQAVERHGLEVESLDISVSDTTATVRGKVKTQSEREKVVLCCGNTAGIARVDDQLEVESSEPEARYYTVVKGDTLSKIAKEFYGNAMKYPQIFEANKPMLEHPDRIYPGQVLRIPPLAE